MKSERARRCSRLDHSHLPIVCGLLSSALSPAEPVRVLNIHSPTPWVHRFDLLVGGRRRSAYVKQSRADRVKRNAFALTRWLPAAGLGNLAPRLLGTVANPDPGSDLPIDSRGPPAGVELMAAREGVGT